MLFFEADILLANVLSELKWDEGVNHNDLATYCEEVKKELCKIGMKDEYVYFEICQSDVTDTVNTYSDFYVQMGDETYSYHMPNPDYFSKRFSKDIVCALKIAAKNYANKREEKTDENRNRSTKRKYQ